MSYYLDPAILTSRELYSNFSDSVTIMISTTTDDGMGNVTTQNTSANVASVTVTSSLPDGNVIISSSNSAVSFSGQYRNGFNDIAKYRYFLANNYLSDTITVNGFSNVPANTYLYEVNQDPASSIIVTYTLNVNFSGGGNTSLSIDRNVTRSYTVGYLFITSFFANFTPPTF